MNFETSKKIQFVVFGDDWERHPSASQHLIAEIKDQFPVIWINSIGMREPRLSLYDLKRVFSKLFKLFKESNSEVSNQNETFKVIEPMVLPYHKYKFVRKLNQRLIKRQLENLLIQDALKVLWVSNPLSDYLKSAVNADRLIYYCGDNFEALPGVDLEEVQNNEQVLFDNASLVVFASDSLKKKRENKCTAKVLLVPHGVNAHAFSNDENPKPAELENITRPIIGYLGIFSEWIDVEFLKKVIAERPQYCFCLIGDTREWTSDLKQFPNVILTGQLPQKNLVNYIRYFSAGLLLYKANEMTMEINPLKMLEYFAQGVPVVSTIELENINGFQHVKVGNTIEQFCNKLDETVNSSAEEKSRLVDQAVNESWMSRMELIFKELELGELEEALMEVV